MPSGRLGLKIEADRDQIEECLFPIARAGLLLDEVELRIVQAIRRTPLVGTVLDPALDRLQEARAIIVDINAGLADNWRKCQTRSKPYDHENDRQ